MRGSPRESPGITGNHPGIRKDGRIGDGEQRLDGSRGIVVTDLGRMLVFAGAVLLMVGLLVWGLGRVGFRGLPGDIRYESENVRIYFPVVTMLVLSVVLSLVLWIIQRLGGR